MVYDPRLHHRRSIRLRGYDYAGGGAYFITICTEVKKCLFGEIIEGEMFLNEVGRLVQKTRDSLPGRFRTLVLDAFQIMPNHLHGVFVLPGPGLEPALAKATGAPVIQPYEDRRGRACPTLVNDRTTVRGRQAVPLRAITNGHRLAVGGRACPTLVNDRTTVRGRQAVPLQNAAGRSRIIS